MSPITARQPSSARRSSVRSAASAVARAWASAGPVSGTGARGRGRGRSRRRRRPATRGSSGDRADDGRRRRSRAPGWTPADERRPELAGRAGDRLRLVEDEVRARAGAPVAGRSRRRRGRPARSRRPATASAPPIEDLVDRQSVAAGERDRDELEGEGAPGPDRRIRRHAAGEIRPDDEGTRPDARSRHRPGRAAPGRRRGRRAPDPGRRGRRRSPTSGSDRATSIRSKPATTAPSGAPSGRRDHPEPDVAAALGGGLVERATQAAERPLAAGRRQVEGVRRGGRAGCAAARSAARRRPAGAARSARGRSAPRRRAGPHPASTAARASSRAPARSGSPIAAPIHGRRGSPRTSISSERAVRFASIRSIAAATSRAASSSAIARRSGSRSSDASIPRSTAPEATSSASRCGSTSYSARAIANGQDDAAAEPVRPAGEIAVDDRPGQRPAGGVEPADPEHPEQRPLAADRRGAARPGRPRAGQRLGALEQAVERSEVVGHGRRMPQPGTDRGRPASTGRVADEGSAGAVRAGSPIQT